MPTILIGFEVRKGSFTNKSTGEMVEYNNRTLRAITDDGANKTNFGYSAFEEKVKLSELAEWLEVPEKDESVDNQLKQLINKPVEFKRAPRNNEFVVVGFKPVK